MPPPTSSIILRPGTILISVASPNKSEVCRHTSVNACPVYVAEFQSNVLVEKPCDTVKPVGVAGGSYRSTGPAGSIPIVSKRTLSVLNDSPSILLGANS